MNVLNASSSIVDNKSANVRFVRRLYFALASFAMSFTVLTVGGIVVAAQRLSATLVPTMNQPETRQFQG